MGHDLHHTTAARSYATAHEAHYESKDLRHALKLYGDIMATYPESAEAGYSRSQIQNIARSVVPEDELLAAEAALASSQLADVPTEQRAATSGSSEDRGRPAG